MNLLGIAIVVHVVLAVVGVGVVGAVPLVARAIRGAALDPSRCAPLFEPLFRVLGVSLGLLFISGAAVEYAAHGAFHESGWFRLSVLLLVVIFVAHRLARAALRKAVSDASALRGVERWGWTMCAAVAVIAFLMTAKPF